MKYSEEFNKWWAERHDLVCLNLDTDGIDCPTYDYMKDIAWRAWEASYFNRKLEIEI